MLGQCELCGGNAHLCERILCCLHDVCPMRGAERSSANALLGGRDVRRLSDERDVPCRNAGLRGERSLHGLRDVGPVHDYGCEPSGVLADGGVRGVCRQLDVRGGDAHL